MCPWYSVRILGDGSVRYEGTAYVHVKGTHKKTIPVSDVNKLTRKLQDDDFLRWEEKTDLCVDYPEVRITANLHGQRKQVLEGCSAPGKILALAELIDTIAGTTNWAGNVREELIQTQRRNGQVVGQNILCPDDPCSNLEGATTASDEVSSGLIGKQITIRGKFSLGGKIGPYILLDNQQQIYLVPKGSFIWGKLYSEMHGKIVTATGVLRFYQDAPTPGLRIQHPPDHYYFDAETVKLRLIGPQ